jgi:lycopene beta-cyclase
MASPPLSSPSEGQHAAAPCADVLLVGAGLANGLLALRLTAARPGLRVVLFDARAPDAPDPHTWSFFASDVEGAVRSWLLPLSAHRWEGYEVRFPAHARALSTPYASLTGEGLGRALRAALGADLRLGRPAAALDAEGVTLDGGERWTAPLVIDGRGARSSAHLSLAWQKFVGLELRLVRPHGLDRPTIMDAAVEQLDGYRFVYLLPFAPDRVLVEDTYYSDGPGLDRAAIEARIAAYAATRGWEVAEVASREEGVLPIALGGDLEAYLAEAGADVPAVGLRAPLFHPVTGYSLPEAAALADDLAGAPELTSRAIAERVRARVRRRWRETAFLRALNRMLFLAAEPEERYRVLQRFYRLPQPLVERFYAGRPTLGDRARILAGAPPVPVGRALKALPDGAAARRRAA